MTTDRTNEDAAIQRLLQSVAKETGELTEKCVKARPEAIDLEMQKYTLNTLIQSMEALKHSLSIMNGSRMPKHPDVSDELFLLSKVCCTTARTLRILILKYIEENGLDLPTLRRVAEQDIQKDRRYNSLADMEAYDTVYRELYPDTPTETPLLELLYGSSADHLN